MFDLVGLRACREKRERAREASNDDAAALSRPARARVKQPRARVPRSRCCRCSHARLGEGAFAACPMKGFFCRSAARGIGGGEEREGELRAAQPSERASQRGG